MNTSPFICFFWGWGGIVDRAQGKYKGLEELKARKMKTIFQTGRVSRIKRIYINGPDKTDEIE